MADLVAFYLENARVLGECLTGQGFRCYGGVNAPYIWLKTPGGTGSWDYDNFAIGQQLSITGVRYNPEVAFWVTPTTADNKTLSLGVPHNPPQDLGYIDPPHVELAAAYVGDLTGATLFLNTDEDNFFENQYTVTDVDNQANSKQLTLNGSVACLLYTSPSPRDRG